MDPSYLENIRRQRDLKQVLANYNVRYYVTPTPRIVGGCFQAVEPLLAGPDSPKMRGTFCMLPVASYNTETVAVLSIGPNRRLQLLRIIG